MTFKFTDLPYDYNALEPYIDAKTMEIHYSKHHKTYYDNMIKALESSQNNFQSIEELLKNISNFSSAVRNNAGGFYNHIVYWESMITNGSKPIGKLAEAINKEFSSLDNLEKLFTEQGLGRFGSGFVWLILIEDANNKKLAVVNTPNQDNPLMDLNDINGIPLLAMDVWEHAYYLKHQNKRIEYIKDFLKVANWEEASQKYEKLI